MVLSGAYGCAHRPPLVCDGDDRHIDYKNKVSKVLLPDDEEEEYAHFKEVKRVDKGDLFTLPLPVRCRSSRRNAERIKKCENRKLFFDENGSPKPAQLLLWEDGGTDLIELVSNVELKKVEWSKEKTDDFFVAFADLFKGLVELGKHQRVHDDVKCENILYGGPNSRMFLIDFGSMKHFEDFKNFKKVSYLPTIQSPLDLFILNKESYEDKEDIFYVQRYHPSFFEICFPDASIVPEQIKKLKKSLGEDAERFRNADYPFTSFRDKAIQTIDLFGLAVALLTMCTLFEKYEGRIKVADVRKFLVECITPDIEMRLLPTEALRMYKAIVSPPRPVRQWSPLKRVVSKIKKSKTLRKGAVAASLVAAAYAMRRSRSK